MYVYMYTMSLGPSSSWSRDSPQYRWVSRDDSVSTTRQRQNAKNYARLPHKRARARERERERESRSDVVGFGVVVVAVSVNNELWRKRFVAKTRREKFTRFSHDINTSRHHHHNIHRHLPPTVTLSVIGEESMQKMITKPQKNVRHSLCRSTKR